MNELTIGKKLTIKSRGLERYFNDVNKNKKISIAREVELSELIKEGNSAAIEELVNANLKFVISVAKQYSSSSDPDLLLDLISQGNIGLFDAAKTYDATKGFKFISYAVWHIRKEILSYLFNSKKTIRVPQNVNSAINKAKKISEKFEQENHREIDECEINDILIDSYDADSTISDWNKAFSLSVGVSSLDISIGDDDSSLSEIIKGDDYISDLSISEKKQNLKRLIETCLEPYYSSVVFQRIGFYSGYVVPWTEIAEQNGKSVEMMRTIYLKSIKIMRNFAKQNGITMSDFEI
jgi:RNA polymerase primary sigma factor